MDDLTLAGEIERQLAARGYSQDRLSRDSGVPKATINRWAQGHVTQPQNWELLVKIAEALELVRVDTSTLLIAGEFPPVDQLLQTGADQIRARLQRWTVESRNNLPGNLTSFVGRSRDVIDTGRLLLPDDVRLVTLTGLGGTGKTRLGIKVASELHDVFIDGLFFVPLVDINAPDEVVPAIASALELRDVPGRTTAERLIEYLRERRVLLLLDNLEHIVGAAPAIVEILTNTRLTTVLATSQVPLGVSFEHVRQVHPFDLPNPSGSARALNANHAVVLFSERSRAVDPDLRLTGRALSAAAEICSRLEGSPLAIELAAARCRRFTPVEILQRFPTLLELGSDGEPDRPDRQQSLRATIAWSHDLLSPPARQLFRRLAAFKGGWPNHAVATICDSGSAEYTELVDVSLVQQVDSGRGRMLETVREYAIEQLVQSGENSLIAGRHAAWFLTLAESAQPYIPQSRQDDWLRAIDNDYANILWLLDTADSETLVRLTTALWPFWHEYGRYIEGRRWLKQALACDAATLEQRASLHTGLMLMEYSRGEVIPAIEHGETALALWSDLNNQRGMALTQLYIGQTLFISGQFTPEQMARVQTCYQTSLDLRQAVDEPLGVARTLCELAILAGTTGDGATAARLSEGALAIYRTEDDRAGIARTLNDQGLFAMLAGDLQTAITLLTESVGYCRLLGDNPHLGWGLFYLGVSWCFAGNPDAAAPALAESLRCQHELDNTYGLAYTLLGFAALRLRQGQYDRAATLCGAVMSLLESSGIVMNPAVQHLYQKESESIRAAGGSDGYERAFAAGRDMPAGVAVTFALAAAGGVS